MSNAESDRMTISIGPDMLAAMAAKGIALSVSAQHVKFIYPDGSDAPLETR